MLWNFRIKSCIFPTIFLNLVYPRLSLPLSLVYPLVCSALLNLWHALSKASSVEYSVTNLKNSTAGLFTLALRHLDIISRGFTSAGSARTAGSWFVVVLRHVQQLGQGLDHSNNNPPVGSSHEMSLGDMSMLSLKHSRKL